MAEVRLRRAEPEPPRERGGQASDRDRSAIEHLSHYASARYISESLLLLRGFALACLLGPAGFGLWSQVKLVLIFLQYGQLGVHEAMQREVPFALGRGEVRKAREIAGNSLGFSLSSALASGLLVLGAAALFANGSPAVRLTWMVLAGLNIVSQLYWYVVLKLRAENRLTLTSQVLVGFAALSTLLGLLGAARWGVAGFLAGCGISHVLAIAWAGGGRSPFPRPRWERKALGELLADGFPIMTSGALVLLLCNMDKLAIWWLLTREDLGIYSLQSYLLLSVLLLPESISAVLYPRLMERAARAGETGHLVEYLTRPSLIMGHFLCPALGVLFLSFHLPVRWLLPEYTPAIAPAMVLIAALYPLALSRVPFTILVALGRQRRLLALTGFSIVLGGASIWTLLVTGCGLVGAAAGAALSFAIYGALCLGAAMVALRVRGRQAASFLGQLTLPFLAAGAGVIVALVLVPSSPGSMLGDLASTILRCLVMLVPAGALTFWAHRNLRLFERRPLGGGDGR